MWPRLLVSRRAASPGCRSPRPQGPMLKPIENARQPADLEGGAKTYTTYCARCHGLDGSGGMGPPLARPRLRRAADEAAIIDILIERHSRHRDDGSLVAVRARDHAGDRLRSLAGAAARRSASRRSGSRAGDLRPRGLRDLPHRRWRGLGAGTRSHRRRHADEGRRSCESRCSIPARRVPSDRCRTSRMAIRPTWSCARSRAAGPRSSACASTRTRSPCSCAIPQGRLHSFRKADLQYLQPEPATSLMPSYRDTLNGGEINDLVAYLMMRRAAR